MKLYSPAFEEGGYIPVKYTCDGEDISVPLVFEDIPGTAASLALIMDDPDAPSGTFVHWVIYDIPPGIEGLPEGIAPDPYLSEGIRQGVNSFGNIGYGGPCPPSGEHRYMFKLYALDKMLEADAGLSKHELLSLMDGHIVEGAGMMGIYGR
ncbi:YbhB/YbcL family Raf kinase inhibitor-like protein [Hydrogenimonas sp.]